ncbi:glutathione S-transferase family protein [Vibrio mangrovi]|uniref:Glutathione S-transferase family protein n=1 Tax=Vibrio mangrovi TaxID=474394 RepID=A0A1Y6ITG8_9VIBR|nr:glutathione S-transferase family protein [Vibrio mangrovi]MDW6004644.1 glutathione S-transferase family protein [Vibrio mangrovi]SMS00934.1 Glutathionyl-hydroquinone reductase YqjG [Vibrio mangrovi]
MLVNGIWTKDWQPVQAKDEQGRFIRQTSGFRHWITPDGEPGPTGDGGFKAEKGRYHLYVAYICPWASRTLMVRALKGLEDYISISVVNPVMTDQGWQFGHADGADFDELNGCDYLHQLYTKVDPQYTGRATVPVLWDKQKQVIVSNESADIIRMLNSAFDHLTGSTVDLYPEPFREEIETLNQRIYQQLNNGVYQAGFASSQFAYEEAYHNVFSMLDELESRLADGRPFLFGDALTETDVRTFVTLVRFDAAYHGVFKCNRNLLAQMPHLYAYTKRIYEIDGIAKTVRIDHIKQGYYSIKALNPGRIIPVGPDSIF